MFGKHKPMMPRPENEKKFDNKNPNDRAVLRTLILLLGLVLVLIVIVVVVSLLVFGM